MRRTFLTLLALALLSGCGFHLRGMINLPESLKTIYVQSSDVPLRDVLADALELSGANVVAGATAGSAVLTITKSEYDQEIRTIDERGKSTGYVLIHRVEFNLRDKDGAFLLNQRQVSARRDFNFDPEQLLANVGEQELLKDEMRRDITQNILQQIARVR